MPSVSGSYSRSYGQQSSKLGYKKVSMSIFKFDDITSNAHFAGFLNGHLAVITLYWDKYYYKAAFVSTFLGGHTPNDGKWLIA